MRQLKTKSLKSKAKIFLFICLFVIFVYSFTVRASVVLNEVAIQPNQIVELYNSASESADISSWYIDDAGGSTYFTIPHQTILPPQSCLLFSSDFNFNKSSTDTVRLFNNTGPPTSSSAQLVELYSYTKAPDATNSFSKKIDGGVEWITDVSSLGLSNESLLSCIPTPTPTPSPTATPTLTPTPLSTPEPTTSPLPTTTSPIDYQNIFISEVYPYPQSNEHEWIELYNGNDVQVNLIHWYIDDGENTGSAPKSFSLVIDPYTYAIVDISSSLFNNSGDVARLLDNNKKEKDSMEYGKMMQGKSMGRISFSEDSYCEQEPSKNAVNSLCVSGPTPKTSPLVLSTQKPAVLAQKKVFPTKKSVAQLFQQTTNSINSTNTFTRPKAGKVLGLQTTETQPSSPTPYLSFISFSYSLLTIVSVFIKMKNA